MRTARGVVYVAYGRRAISAVKASVASLKRYNSFPVVVISDKINLEIPGAETVQFRSLGGSNIQQSRNAKLRILSYVPEEWNSVLYLDADTEVQGKLTQGFKVLEKGWDLAIVPSAYQGRGLFQHIEDMERGYTVETLRNPEPLQLQAGVMFVRRSETTMTFFQNWRAEWRRFGSQDQAALLRALDKTPIRICLLGRNYNGGDLVAHHFGRAR